MSQVSHDDDHQEREITWVGAQWLMAGYCGRATPEPATTPGAPTDAELRPVAPVRRRKPWQARVVRIGPPRRSENASPSQRAA